MIKSSPRKRGAFSLGTPYTEYALTVSTLLLFAFLNLSAPYVVTPVIKAVVNKFLTKGLPRAVAPQAKAGANLLNLFCFCFK